MFRNTSRFSTVQMVFCSVQLVVSSMASPATPYWSVSSATGEGLARVVCQACILEAAERHEGRLNRPSALGVAQVGHPSRTRAGIAIEAVESVRKVVVDPALETGLAGDFDAVARSRMDLCKDAGVKERLEAVSRRRRQLRSRREPSFNRILSRLASASTPKSVLLVCRLELVCAIVGLWAVQTHTGGLRFQHDISFV